MASWVTHLMIADRVLESIPALDRREYCVGNIAPDCNIENADFTGFTPPREVTHWMTLPNIKDFSCAERFYHERIESRDDIDRAELSFLLGYYTHLIVDAAFQKMTRDPERVKDCFRRLNAVEELHRAAEGFPEDFDTVKKLIPRSEWEKDIAVIEREYLDAHPDSCYITEILPLKSFPDRLDFLPKGAITRKVEIMGVMPEIRTTRWPFLVISREEYALYVERTAQLVIDRITEKNIL